ncbi:MAG: (Fe-S)-binding protein [Candidatus Eisenbacteria bacterium]|uniref:Glycolate oxidase iron-sulfur subunit n=1 Tax=Eiseniibacteriota bacterium TaxID=2212470 RepID=A0A538U2R9_UNCEI|nr:MAG: (Fe-S)-binding protein [Candidatus Eisenbacteria bacterium]
MSTPASPPSLPWFDDEDAPSRRDLETCIHCGLCLTACPTYRELKIEPDSPRGRLYLMRGLAEGRIAAGDDLVHHLDQCLGCRACETVCPAGVPYGRLLEETRGQLERRRPRRTPLAMIGRWALRHLVPHRARMQAAADLLRIGQSRPMRALMASGVGRRLPAFARRGYAMTPPLLPRRERGLGALAGRLPEGARVQSRGDRLVFHPAGTPKKRVGFFTTCVMETMFPRVNQEAVRLLVLAGCEVVVPQAQGCCGALQAHTGLRRESKSLARRNLTAFPAELDAIVTTSAGCGASLREYGHWLGEETASATAFAARVRDVSEVLLEVGLPAARARLASRRDPERPLRVGYHDPCHLAHAQKVRRPPRELLAALPGVELIDLPDADQCCGSAGVYNLTHPEMAEAQLEKKLAAVRRVDPEVVVASNPGCLLHMARGAEERGVAARMVHLVEVLGQAWPAPQS